MKSKKGTVLMSLGVLCILLALGLLIYNQYEANEAEEASKVLLEELTDEPEKGPEKEIGKECIGTLTIPKLGLTLPVIKDWSYPNLKLAPCKYSGSMETGDLVIMAHNYKAHFGNLSALEPGDPIYFEDLKHEKTTFQAAGFETLKPDQIEEMKAGEYPLTLFTCTYGGRTRVVLRCNRTLN